MSWPWLEFIFYNSLWQFRLRELGEIVELFFRPQHQNPKGCSGQGVRVMWKAPRSALVCLALLGLAAWPVPRASAQEQPFPSLFESQFDSVKARAVMLVGSSRTEQTVVLGAALFYRPKKATPAESDEDLTKLEKAEPLLGHMTEGVKDSSPLPTRWHENIDEQYAFSRVLYRASQISAQAFRRGVRQDLTYSHVMEQPSRYRGQVIHVEGLLKQLRRYDPPLSAKQAGVVSLYEGWIFGSHYATQPWCVVFTELPRGLQLGDGLNVPVSADGYFFKRYSYRSRGSGPRSTKAKPWPEAPLLIGRTLTLPAGPAEVEQGEGEWMNHLLPVFLILLGVSLAVAIGLGLWYRRGDRKVHARLEAAGRRPFVLPEIDSSARAEGTQPEV
jgi:hypothetical protein